MKKLKLNLDDLKVESFATTPDAASGRGTVFGQVTHPYDSNCGTCPGNTNCGTCNGESCDYPGCTAAGLTCVDPCGPGGSEAGTCGPANTCVTTCEPQSTCPSPTCGVSCGGGELTNCPGETECEPEPTWTANGCTLCDQMC